MLRQANGNRLLHIDDILKIEIRNYKESQDILIKVKAIIHSIVNCIIKWQ